MSQSTSDEFDYHKMYFKNVAFDLDEIVHSNNGISPKFKSELMPKIRVLREKMQLYDNFKCTTIDVADTILGVIECCIEMSKSNPIIYNYIRSKILGCNKV